MAVYCHYSLFSRYSLPSIFPGNRENGCRKSTTVGVRCIASSSKEQEKKIAEPVKQEVKKKVKIVEQVKLEPKLQCNSYRMKQNCSWSGGFSLGIDLGLARTGVAVSNGYAPRPVSVLEMRGEPLERRLIEIAEKEEVDELIIGIPKSSDGTENVQSNKVRSIAGRIAVRAAERGWRVYLQNEYGTSADALDLMINIGKNKRARHEKIDAYAAVILLKRYFEMAGSEAELVWPKDTALQEKIRQRKAMSLFDDEDGFDYFTL
ncbi:hypothetical protein SUGI_0333620 [Cryptomeria japonica]|uniref:uncharacterized protein LOC131078378 isoform X1 n=1 Tax=Cryptomeria japonica TaxID=3369 RepID=UPI002408D654|nr:uncharacterized protein LOC131078378 isoform X1 [Cryptomeria japonica]GLJ18704.1 hypothetical protein SUGI_0333620 [Cryptomeria japonica]